MSIIAKSLHFKDLNDQIKAAGEYVHIEDCYGQRFIAAGMKGVVPAGNEANKKTIVIDGTPGNALGAYLDGATIEVRGNAQDATGDTMNDGKIIIHGNAGDALGYAMRGGEIYVKGNTGYRSGIHMKEYSRPELGIEKKPVMVIGGKTGSFLGEYLAGGLIIVLGIGAEKAPPIGNFTGTGMHGGKIFIRSEHQLESLPAQVCVEKATSDDLKKIERYIEEYGKHFGVNTKTLLKDNFWILTPNAKNPYKQLYTMN